MDDISSGMRADAFSSHGFLILNFVIFPTCLELDWSTPAAHNGPSVTEACAFGPTSHASFLAFLRITKIRQLNFFIERPLWLILADSCQIVIHAANFVWLNQ